MKKIFCIVGLLMGALSSAQDISLTDHSTIDNIDDSNIPSFSTASMSTRYRYHCPVRSTMNLFCTMIYAPTCGWYDPSKVNCFAYPCAANFSNPCMACKDLTIKYITCGKCPQVSYPMDRLNYITSSTTKLPTCLNSNIYM